MQLPCSYHAALQTHLVQLVDAHVDLAEQVVHGLREHKRSASGESAKQVVHNKQRVSGESVEIQRGVCQE
jgi:hypothetical protein